MSSRVVQAEIARLDEISRRRALYWGETIQLEKMLRMERRYARMAEKRKPGHVAAPDATIDGAELKAGQIAIGTKVQFTFPTKSGPRTYEATVCGYRPTNGATGWVETIDEAGFRRSVQPVRCQVLG